MFGYLGAGVNRLYVEFFRPLFQAHWVSVERLKFVILRVEGSRISGESQGVSGSDLEVVVVAPV